MNDEHRRTMALNKQVARFGPFKDFIANGVKVGNTIYLSGQVSVDADGHVVGVGDLTAQVRQSYANVKEVLAGFGATMDNIVDEMWLVTDTLDAIANIDAAFGVRDEAYGRIPDVAQTTVRVAGLVRPEFLIEIKCVARL
jgi:enamine deaminase RidA (YjgF/YER057c/UK114 family)